MRGADPFVVRSPESRCTGIGTANRNLRLAPVSPARRFFGPVVVSVVPSGAAARKLAVGV